jgi:transcriptional regulator with XRE-family HTH domain
MKGMLSNFVNSNLHGSINQGFHITTSMTHTIQARIRQARVAKKLTQRQVADAVGVSTQAVNQWEKTTEPSNDNLAKLAYILGVSADYLLRGGDANPHPETFPEWLGMVADRDLPIVDLHMLSSVEDIDLYIDLYNDNAEDKRIIRTRYPASARSVAFIMPDSGMEPEIFEGDTIVIDALLSLRPGDFVAASIKPRNVTVFRQFLYDGPDHCLLRPANPHYRPYRFTTEACETDVDFLGVMTEFTRPAPRRRR